LPAEVKWLSGAEYVKRFDYPEDRLFTKVFCAECGSGLPFLNKSGEKLFIPAGSLDSEPGILPGHNIFWADRSSWYEAGISAPKSEGFVDAEADANCTSLGRLNQAGGTCASTDLKR
jgi:hypothetical protein